MKRRIVRRKKPYEPPVLPEKPKVTVGPRCYGKTKKGRYIVCRFSVMRMARYFWKSSNWYVIDMEDGNIASGTKASGYPSKSQAVTVARKYRDEYGAWAVMPF